MPTTVLELDDLLESDSVNIHLGFFFYVLCSIGYLRSETYLSSKAESITVRESGAGIMEDTRTVYLPLEVRRRVGVLGYDHISMTAAVFMNMIDSVIDIRDYFYGALECAVFGSHTFGGGWAESQ